MEPDDYKITIDSMNTITITSYDANIHTIDHNYNWITINTSDNNVVFKDCMPGLAELEKMCEEYPGLDKAFENFKTFYKLVEQDWRGKQKEKDKFL